LPGVYGQDGAEEEGEEEEKEFHVIVYKELRIEGGIIIVMVNWELMFRMNHTFN
jgi:hypothetical protein